MRRAVSVVVLTTLLAVAASPLAAASRAPAGMACCRTGQAMTCCVLDGSCALKSCPPAAAPAEFSLLPPLVLPSFAGLPSPSSLPFAEAARLPALLPPATPVLDPPPRG